MTNIIRDAFVRAALDDVPSVDYAEQYRELMTKHAVSRLPPAVRKLWDNKVLRDYVALVRVGSRYSDFGAYVPGMSDFLPSDDASSAGAALKKQHDDQEDRRAKLHRDLRGIAYSVRTRKALVEALPEFEKYLPADEVAANRSVPAIANLVSDFAKAGWPKGKKSDAAPA